MLQAIAGKVLGEGCSTRNGEYIFIFIPCDIELSFLGIGKPVQIEHISTP